MPISKEEMSLLGERIITLVHDDRFREDHLAFKLLVYLLVHNLETQRSQLSARYLHELSGIAIGHLRKVLERLSSLGYIVVHRPIDDSREPPTIKRSRYFDDVERTKNGTASIYYW
jgi:hypothetical protein